MMFGSELLHIHWAKIWPKKRNFSLYRWAGDPGGQIWGPKSSIFEYNIDIWPWNDVQGHFRSNRKYDFSTPQGRYTYSMSHFRNSRTSNKGTSLLSGPCIRRKLEKWLSPTMGVNGAKSLFQKFVVNQVCVPRCRPQPTFFSTRWVNSGKLNPDSVRRMGPSEQALIAFKYISQKN